MFYRCSELEKIYLEINFNIDSIAYALSNCPNLYGDIIINKIPTKYNNFFTNSALSDKILSLKGIGNELQQIYQTKSEESNIKMVSN